MEAFRWTVLGTGRAARMFALGLRSAPGHAVTTVGSRAVERGRRFIDALGLDAQAVDTEDALNRPADAVYIATPPSAHARLAVAALERALAVLVEKPFATAATDAEEVVAAARRSGTFCMEAMWTRFLPLSGQVERLLGDGVIGEVVGVVGSLGSAAVASPHLLDPALGGGALLDRGVYPLSLAIRALGEPEHVSAARVEGHTGVDVECAAVLRHRGSALSTLQASLRGALSNDLRYVGTEGAVHVHAPIYRPSRATLVRYPAAGAGTGRSGGDEDDAMPVRPVTDGRLAQGARQAALAFAPVLAQGRFRPLWRPYRGNGYQYQALEVARCLRQHRTESLTMPLAETVAVLRTVERIRDAWCEPGMERALR